MNIEEAIKRLQKDTDELMVYGDVAEVLIKAQKLGIEALERIRDYRRRSEFYRQQFTFTDLLPSENEGESIGE